MTTIPHQCDDFGPCPPSAVGTGSFRLTEAAAMYSGFSRKAGPSRPAAVRRHFADARERIKEAARPVVERRRKRFAVGRQVEAARAQRSVLRPGAAAEVRRLRKEANNPVPIRAASAKQHDYARDVRDRQLYAVKSSNAAALRRRPVKPTKDEKLKARLRSLRRRAEIARRSEARDILG